jgi:hypothetical protein
MTILDTVKDAVKLAQQIDNIELYRQILNLQAEIQSQFNENLILKQQIADLKEELKIRGSLRFDDGQYLLKTDSGSEDGPFCSICWDVDHRLVRMVRGGYEDGFFCQYCSNIRKKT